MAELVTGQIVSDGSRGSGVRSVDNHFPGRDGHAIVSHPQRRLGSIDAKSQIASIRTTRGQRGAQAVPWRSRDEQAMAGKGKEIGPDRLAFCLTGLTRKCLAH